jgi:hypothetical protein
LVDAVYLVGQPNAKHYIQLAATDVDSATVDAAYMNEHYHTNDIVTLHVTRTNKFNNDNGPDYRDGRLMNLRIAKVDADNRRLSFTDPIRQDFDVDLGSTVYAYVSKGVHVHVSLFLGGSDGVMLGVNQPPRLYVRPPMDQFQMMWSTSWDALMGYQPWNPYVVTPVFTSGMISMFGPAPLQA